MQGLVCSGGLGHTGDFVIRPQRTDFVVHRQLGRCRECFNLIAEKALLNKLVKDAFEQNFRCKLLVLLRQPLLKNDHVTQRDIFAIHGRHDRVRADVTVCITTVWQRNCEDRSKRSQVRSESHSLSFKKAA